MMIGGCCTEKRVNSNKKFIMSSSGNGRMKKPGKWEMIVERGLL